MRANVINLVFIGLAALRATLGLTDRHHPGFIEVIKSGRDSVGNARKASGIFVADADQAQVWLDQGLVSIAWGVDFNMHTRDENSLANRFNSLSGNWNVS